MAKRKKPEKFNIDITKMSVEELKKMRLDDILIYINELEDTKTVIIYFFNIIKQIPDSNHKLTKFRKIFRDIPDLEEKLDEIYRFIDDNKLLLDLELETNKNEIESRLEKLRYSDLKKIDKLEDKKLKVPYKTTLQEYNDVKECMRKFFAKICTLYTNTMHEIEDRKQALEDSINILLKLQDTPQIGTHFNMGTPYEDLLKKTLQRAGLIDRDEKLREINKEKAKRFYERQKKERGLDQN